MFYLYYSNSNTILASRVEFEIEGESTSGVLLISYDFISHVYFEKRTIRILIKTHSIKCLQ